MGAARTTEFPSRKAGAADAAVWFDRLRAMGRKGFWGVVALAALASTLVAGPPARAQSGTQTTPNGRYTLISKDVAGERWAITLNLRDGSVTGNVFRTD